MITRFVAVLFLLPALSFAGDRVYCDDPEAVADWERQVAEAPNDPAIQMLHGLWLGLCEKIRAGSVGPDMAIDIFERERARQALERAREELDHQGVTGT